MRIVKATLLALILLGVPVKAWAACTMETIFLPDGKVMYCQTCCWNGVCTTNCTGG
jgi:hypothetical protein